MRRESGSRRASRNSEMISNRMETWEFDGARLHLKKICKSFQFSLKEYEQTRAIVCLDQKGDPSSFDKLPLYDTGTCTPARNSRSKRGLFWEASKEKRCHKSEEFQSLKLIAGNTKNSALFSSGITVQTRSFVSTQNVIVTHVIVIITFRSQYTNG